MFLLLEFHQSPPPTFPMTIFVFPFVLGILSCLGLHHHRGDVALFTPVSSAAFALWAPGSPRSTSPAAAVARLWPRHQREHLAPPGGHGLSEPRPEDGRLLAGRRLPEQRLNVNRFAAGGVEMSRRPSSPPTSEPASRNRFQLQDEEVQLGVGSKR